MTRIRLHLSLVLVALLVSGAVVEAQDIFEIERGSFATPELRISEAMGQRRRVQVRSTDNLTGRLRIETGAAANVIATYTKQARTESRSRAFDYIDVISVTIDVLPDYVRVDLRAPNPAPWTDNVESGQVDIRLTLPVDCEVRVEAAYFDIEAVGPFAELLVPASYGRLDVSGVNRKLELGTKNQRVTVSDVAGDIAVSTTNALLSATGVKSGDMTARFNNDGGEIRIDGVRGQINVRNNFGRIDIAGFTASGESSFIRGSSEPITIQVLAMPVGQLVVSNRYDDIELLLPADISAYFSLSVEDNSIIEAVGIPFWPDLVKPNRLAFRSGNADVSISGSVRGKGNIYVRGTGRDDQ